MIKIKEIFVRSFEIEKINIFWEIVDMTDTDDITAYQIYVLKSTAIAGPYTTIGGPLINCFSFQDTTNIVEHKSGNIYYKLKIIDKRNQETTESTVIAQVPEPDLVALELIRMENLLFRVCIGRKCWIFNKKTFGRCSCFDKVSRQLTKSNHLPCYGSGFLGGYSTPIEQYVQIDPPQNSYQPNQNIPNTVKITSARLISYPMVSAGDVIVESENHRWIVVSTTQSERLRHPIRQELMIKQLQDGDMVYKLPILTELKDHRVSDERLFTNPMTL